MYNSSLFTTMNTEKLVDLIVIGDEAFETAIVCDEVLKGAEYQLKEGKTGPFVEGPNDFVARLYHAERDTKTPIVILTQNDPVFPECYPLPYVGKDMRFDLKFSSKDALNRMAELINMLTQAQDHYQRAVAGHLGQDYVFQFPSDFYTVLDFSYFTTASEFLSHASIGMLIKETSMGSYALLSMALHTDVPLEVPLVIFSVITLK
jgi:hypothetical protein